MPGNQLRGGFARPLPVPRPLQAAALFGDSAESLLAAVAGRLCLPVSALSVEMTYRGIYHFTVAHQHGKATELVAYLAENADWLGILKRKRKRKTPPPDLLLTNAAGA